MRRLLLALAFAASLGAAEAQIAAPPAQLQNFQQFGGYSAGSGGQFYANPIYITPGVSGTIGAANSYYCAPFPVYANIHISALGVRINSTDSATPGGYSSGQVLGGAIFADLITSNGHRPGTLIDYVSTPFSALSAVPVSSALHNGTDALAPGQYWTCVQPYDTSITWVAFNNNPGLWLVGSSTVGAALSTNSITGVQTTGSTFNSWASFTGATSWTARGQPAAPTV